MNEVVFTRKLLVYVPAYNCRETIIGVLNSMSDRVSRLVDILVIDNCSSDGTADVLTAAKQSGVIRPDVTIVRTAHNLGYAGSQKLAYALACRSPQVEWVAMLHGDGQYPSELLDKFADRLTSKAGIVFGHRSKLWYPLREETPIITWLLIRGLSLLESAITGVFHIEWHSGFTMYATRFLRRVDLSAITDTPHIDGHFLYAAHALHEKVETLPIYKRYKSLSPFEGEARRRYVMDVLQLMWIMPARKEKLSVRPGESQDRGQQDCGYTVLG